jgi:NAD(P)-dependent dehydrogenase (short-subunit alcohol dehydrogenase family)
LLRKSNLAERPNSPMKAIVLTGASSGLGKSTTLALIQAGYHVFGSVRKPEDARRLQEEFGNTFHALQFDVTDQTALQIAAGQVREELHGETLHGLINNAGVALAGPLLHVRPEDLRRQLEINVTAVLMMTQTFVPLLGADRSLRGKPGRVVNIGSILGKISMPFVGPYSTSKYALEGLTDALRMELMLYGIAVSIIRSGPIATPMFDKAESSTSSTYQNTDYGPLTAKAQAIYDQIHKSALPPEAVAQVVLQAISDRTPRPHYYITDSPFLGCLLPLLMPKGLLYKRVAKDFGLSPENLRDGRASE